MPPMPSKKLKTRTSPNAEFCMPTSRHTARLSASARPARCADQYPRLSAMKLWIKTPNTTRPTYWRKFCQLAASAPQTIKTKNNSAKIRKGRRTLSARPGKIRVITWPIISGIPRITNTVIKTSTGLSRTVRRISAVWGFRLPQRERLSGVMIIAATVETAVMEMETAQLPLAR